MSDFDPESFESELERLKPAAPPAPLIARLQDIPRPRPVRLSLETAKALARQLWPRWVWLTATATGALVLVVALLVRSGPEPTAVVVPSKQPLAASPVLQADQVEIDQHLLASFDAVANLPGGEPVRLHCREWMEEVRFRDSAKGVVVERQAPRLEVVPVNFETY